ncbi:GntR family transcriptional regulator [Butyrivibrio sp. NC2002]|uniref:GntR family transcriptional regulator n=1 Tax=Butyrivibrio sp. NC2002 TaxID=1410610 RepID=UPI00056C9ECE|nr:GntR family transcriptional regulator [Butyrivibrio sp. NC2002]
MSKELRYEKIYSDLKGKIKSGELKSGDKLPSELELAEEYGVSRITSKKAMEILTQEGLAIRTRGRGSYVTEDAKDILENATAFSHEKPKDISFSKDANMIGVIVDTFSEDFGSEMLRGIERECHRQNLRLLFGCTYGSIESENDTVRQFIELGAKGIIVMCVHGEVYNNTLLELGLKGYPLVLVDRPMKGIPIPCVKTDNYKAAYELTNKLLKNGDDRICFVTHADVEMPTLSERYDGFTAAVMEHDNVSGTIAHIEMQDGYSENTREFKVDYSGALKLLKAHKDCNTFLATEYKIAVLLNMAANELKRDIAIATFDEIAAFYNGGKTFLHIRQDENRIGIEAVQMLSSIIKGEKKQGIVNVPYKLIDE